MITGRFSRVCGWGSRRGWTINPGLALAIVGVATAAAQVETNPTTEQAPRWMRCTGADVNVRSHPDRNALAVIKLDAGARLREVGRDGPWSKIEPPAGSFCYVHSNFVVRSEQGTGVVDETLPGPLRVRGGSTLSEQAPELSEQVGRLNPGTRVRILGEKDDWLKIAPPEGVYYYVYSEYLEAETESSPPADTAASGASPLAGGDSVADHVAENGDSSGSAFDEVAEKQGAREIPTGPWATRLRAVEARITQEAPKSSAEQDWSSIVADLRPIAAQSEDRDTATYAAGWIQRIEERVTKLEAMQNHDTAVSAPSLHSPRGGADSAVPPPSQAAPSATSRTEEGEIEPVPAAADTGEESPVATTPESTVPSGTATLVNTTGPTSQPAIVVPEPPAAAITQASAELSGVLAPSFAVAPGPYGLRYRVVDRYSRDVRGYVEFPALRGFDAPGSVGKYVRVTGVKYRDPQTGVELIRAETLTTITLKKE